MSARDRRAWALFVMGRAARWLPWLTVLAVFFGARWWYRVRLGVRFDASTTEYCLQFVDRAWLRDDLLRTLWSLHHQAPLLDGMVGVALKLSPDRFHELLDGAFVVAALGLALGLLSVLRRLGVHPLVATLATCAYTAAPTVILYESWLFYHHLVTAFFVLSLVALQRFMRRETLASGVAFYLTLTLIVMTRATFGLVFMAGLTAVLLVAGPVRRGLVLKAAAVPMLCVALYNARVHAVTGRSLGHALVGPNLVIKTLDEIPRQTRDALLASGELSELARGPAFPNLERNPDLRAEGVPVTGVPALDVLVHANGELNGNALQYAYLGDVWMRDAKVVLRRHPDAYLRAVRNALVQGYFRSAANDQNITKAIVYPPFKALEENLDPEFVPQPDESLEVLAVSFSTAFLYALTRLLSPRAYAPSRRARTTVLAVALATIVYAATSLLISYGDFARYRFEVDVLYAVLLAVLADDALRFVGGLPWRVWQAVRRRRA